MFALLPPTCINTTIWHDHKPKSAFDCVGKDIVTFPSISPLASCSYSRYFRWYSLPVQAPLHTHTHTLRSLMRRRRRTREPQLWVVHVGAIHAMLPASIHRRRDVLLQFSSSPRHALSPPYLFPGGRKLFLLIAFVGLWRAAEANAVRQRRTHRLIHTLNCPRVRTVSNDRCETWWYQGVLQSQGWRGALGARCFCMRVDTIFPIRIISIWPIWRQQAPSPSCTILRSNNTNGCNLQSARRAPNVQQINKVRDFFGGLYCAHH